MSDGEAIVTFRRKMYMGDDVGVLSINAVGVDLGKLVSRQEIRRIVLCFARVQFISSLFLAMLIKVQEEDNKHAVRLILSGMSRQVIRETFSISKLDKLFQITDEGK